MCWNMGAVIAWAFVSLTGWLHNAWPAGCSARSWCMAAASMALFGVVACALPGGPSTLKGEGMAAGWTAMKESWVTFFQSRRS